MIDNDIELTKTVKIKERKDKKKQVLQKKGSAEDINMKKSVADKSNKISGIEMSKTVQQLADDQE